MRRQLRATVLERNAELIEFLLQRPDPEPEDHTSFETISSVP